MQKRIKNINKFTKQPIKYQNNIFKFLIKKGIKTKFGQEHNFNNITSYIKFKKQIPIRTYEELSKYILDAKKGKKSIHGLI